MYFDIQLLFYSTSIFGERVEAQSSAEIELLKKIIEKSTPKSDSDLQKTKLSDEEKSTIKQLLKIKSEDSLLVIASKFRALTSINTSGLDQDQKDIYTALLYVLYGTNETLTPSMQDKDSEESKNEGTVVDKILSHTPDSLFKL